MGQKLPKADLNFGKYKDAALLYAAQNIHNSLVAAVADFPTPPVTMANFQLAIDSFQSTSVLAFKGTKNQTANKKDAKFFLKELMRTLGIYVTQVAQSNYTVNKNYQFIAPLILEAGFKISKTPTPPGDTSGLLIPIIKKAISKTPGQLYILLRQYKEPSRGKKMFQINYRTSEIPAVPPATVPTPAGPWITFTPTGSNKVIISGLPSGMYDYEIAVVGGQNTKLNSKNPLNYSPIRQVIVT